MSSLFTWISEMRKKPHRRHGHHHHKKSHAAPNAAFIRDVELNTHYQHWRFTVSTATLTWTLPTTRTDGTALASTEIASVNVFDDASPTPTVPIGTTSGTAVTFTTAVLIVGVHNFTVTVVDTTGHTSAVSNVATVTVPATLASPTAVTNLAATLNP
jgi:hypothetical protein